MYSLPYSTKSDIVCLFAIICAGMFPAKTFATVPLTISASVQTVPNLTDDIILTFTFDQNVNGFTADDVSVTNASKGIFSASSPKEYRLTINPSTNATIQISVPTAAATGVNAADGDSESAGLNIPIVPITISFSPADNANNVAINAAFSLTFTEPINKGTGNITIRKTDGNTVVRQIDVATATSELTFSADRKTVTINPNPPATNLEVNTDYNIQMPSGALKDDDDNAYTGINNATTWNFKTTAQTTAVFLFSSPIANAGKVTVCDGTEISFSASPIGTASYKFKRERGGTTTDFTQVNSVFTRADFQNGDKISVEVSGVLSNVIEIEEKPRPTAVITAPTLLTYNIIEAPVTLVGSLENGRFSGRGVVETEGVFKFFPSLAGVGNHVVTYTAEANNCSAFTSKTFIVIQEGRIFSNIDPAAVYCTNSNPITFAIIPTTYNPAIEEPVEFLYWNYPGWIIIPAPNTVFDPSQSYYNRPEQGDVNYIGVRLRNKNTNATREIFQSVKVIASSTVNFRGLTKTFFCTNEDINLPLIGIVNGEESTGGTFKIRLPDNSVQTLSNRTFNPSDFTASGTYRISYEATVGACSSSETQDITIQAAPQVNFSFANTCAADTVVFTNLSTPGSAADVLVYSWDFGDGFILSSNAGPIEEGTHNGQTTGTYENPKHKYSNPGSYIVKLSVSIQTATQCAPEKQIPIVISPEPQAKFTVTKVCSGDFTVFDGERGSVTIAKWSWDFGDGDSLTAGNGDITSDPHNGRTRGSFENPEHQYAAIGTYTVTLTVESDKGCTHILIKTISIFPQVSTYPYREDFETNGKNGWVSGGKNPSWQFRNTEPAPINDSISIQYAASGRNAWITNDDSTYNNNEFSYVESPCFDLRQLSRPMIVIKTAYFTDRGLDGAVLQATVDDGKSWQTVGEFGAGENWYNTSLIIAHPDTLAPINERAGWSGIDTVWKESHYSLDDFKNAPLIRFRVAFGSNSENTPGIPPAGFAFDDVFVGERSRTVLFEHFTNTNSDVTLPPDTIKINDNIINSYIANDAVVLRYHVEIQGKEDPINQENKSDPSARALLYGISSLPRTAIDGQNIFNANKQIVPFIISETNTSGNIGPRKYQSRTLVQSPFNIVLSLPASPQTTLPITAEITKTDISTSGPFVIQIALVQKSVAVGTDTFKNVVRKLLPNAAGNRIVDPTWAQGITKKVNVPFVPNTIIGPLLQAQSNGFAVAVFIQDENTKEVYQALMQDIPAELITSLVTGTDKFQDGRLSIYPNPASNEVHIRFSEALTTPLLFRVFDAFGKTIDSRKMERGTSEYVLHTNSYSNGFYILETRQYGNQTGIRKKLVIAR